MELFKEPYNALEKAFEYFVKSLIKLFKRCLTSPIKLFFQGSYRALKGP